MRAVELLRRAARKPPHYLARRAWTEARQFAMVHRLRRRLELLTNAKLAREGGFTSLASYWDEVGPKGFIYTAADRGDLRALYRDGPLAPRLPGLRRQIEKILFHEFDILGSGPVNLGGKINWHLDFKSGRQWELRPAKEIDYAELDLPSDVKVPWELSRGHHLVTLGQAWVVDRNEAAVHEFESQIRSWIGANPPGFGINWACTMEVAIRAVNWIWAMALLADAPLAEDFREAILLSLYQHGLWIPAHLEISHVNGNHYIADALGLVGCGALFRGFPEGRSWLEQGMQILEKEILLQVEDDGVDIEASIPYHRLVLEIYLTAARFSETAGRTPSPAYNQKLEAMMDFVNAYIAPNGLAPVIGDADDGRVLEFEEKPKNDHRYLLSTGSALFDRNDLKARSGAFWEYSLWFLGPRDRGRYENLAPEPAGHDSKTFPVSGFYVLRSPEQFLFIDAGPVGFRGLGGHGHNDCLSFEWHALGQPLLIDSGLFVYTASPQWRDRFRSTGYHNTIRIDGVEINHFLSPPTLWFLGNDAQPLNVEYGRKGETEFLTAGHTGFRRLPDPVTVFRHFEQNRTRPEITIIDRLEGSDEHTVEFFFHAAPGAAFTRASDSTFDFVWPGAVRMHAEWEAPFTLKLEEREGWFAPSYGVKISRPVCVASARVRLPVKVEWNLSVDKVEAAT